MNSRYLAERGWSKDSKNKTNTDYHCNRNKNGKYHIRLNSSSKTTVTPNERLSQKKNKSPNSRRSACDNDKNLKKMYNCLKKHFEPTQLNESSSFVAAKKKKSQINIQDISNQQAQVQIGLNESLNRRSRLNSMSRSCDRGKSSDSNRRGITREKRGYIYYSNDNETPTKSKKQTNLSLKKSASKLSKKLESEENNSKELSKILYDLSKIKQTMLKNKRKYELSLCKLKESRFNIITTIRKKAELMLSDYDRQLTSYDLIVADRINQIEHEEYVIDLALGKKYMLSNDEFEKIKNQSKFFENFQMETPQNQDDFSDLKLITNKELLRLQTQAESLTKVITTNNNIINEDTKISFMLEEEQKRNSEQEKENTILIRQQRQFKEITDNFSKDSINAKQDSFIEMEKLRGEVEARSLIMNNLAIILKNFEENLCNYEEIEISDTTRNALSMIREGIETVNFEKIVKSNISQGVEDIVKVQRNLTYQLDTATLEFDKLAHELSSVQVVNDKLKGLEQNVQDLLVGFENEFHTLPNSIQVIRNFVERNVKNMLNQFIDTTDLLSNDNRVSGSFIRDEPEVIISKGISMSNNKNISKKGSEKYASPNQINSHNHGFSFDPHNENCNVIGTNQSIIKLGRHNALLQTNQSNADTCNKIMDTHEDMNQEKNSVIHHDNKENAGRISINSMPQNQSLYLKEICKTNKNISVKLNTKHSQRTLDLSKNINQTTTIIMRDSLTQTEFEDQHILAPFDCRKCVRCGTNDLQSNVCFYSIQCPSVYNGKKSSFCIMNKEKTSDYHVYPKGLGDLYYSDGVFKKNIRNQEALKVHNRGCQTLIGVFDILFMKKSPLETYADIDNVLLTPKSEYE